MPRRSGDWGGSVSRMTKAEITRWVRNWYDCSWSRRVAMARSPAEGGEQALDRVVHADHAAGEREQRHDREDVGDVGEPADGRGRGTPAVDQAGDQHPGGDHEDRPEPPQPYPGVLGPHGPP